MIDDNTYPQCKGKEHNETKVDLPVWKDHVR